MTERIARAMTMFRTIFIGAALAGLLSTAAADVTRPADTHGGARICRTREPDPPRPKNPKLVLFVTAAAEA